MSESKELTVPERAAIAVGAAEHEKHLIVLSTKYADITKIANVAGRDQVHAGYMELKNARVAIEKAGKDAREDANAFQKAVIEEVKRLTAITTDEEARLQALRDEYDAEREREKAAKAAVEKARVDGIRQSIDGLRAYATSAVGRSSQQIAAMVETLEGVEITLETHMEFAGEAQAVQAATVAKLMEMLAAQQSHEAEQARLAEERAQLERERAEAADRERIAALARAEEERKAREAREQEEARIRAEREAHEAKLRAEREEIEAILRGRREAEEAMLAAQRIEIARQQAEIAAAKAEQERVERERQTAIEAEVRAKRESEEAAARAETERVEAERRAAVQEQIRREQEHFAANGPGDVEIVKLLAREYDVEIGDVMGWMKKFDYAAADEYFAAANVAANQLEKAA